MMIFHSYVSLPEGTQNLKKPLEHIWKSLEHDFWPGISCQRFWNPLPLKGIKPHLATAEMSVELAGELPAAIEQVQAHSFTPTRTHSHVNHTFVIFSIFHGNLYTCCSLGKKNIKFLPLAPVAPLEAPVVARPRHRIAFGHVSQVSCCWKHLETAM